MVRGPTPFEQQHNAEHRREELGRTFQQGRVGGHDDSDPEGGGRLPVAGPIAMAVGIFLFGLSKADPAGAASHVALFCIIAMASALVTGFLAGRSSGEHKQVGSAILVGVIATSYVIWAAIKGSSPLVPVVAFGLGAGLFFGVAMANLLRNRRLGKVV